MIDERPGIFDSYPQSSDLKCFNEHFAGYIAREEFNENTYIVILTHQHIHDFEVLKLVVITSYSIHYTKLYEAAQMINQSKYVFNYDENHLNLDFTYFNWNTSGLEWNNFYKYEYTFDADARITEEKLLLWNSIDMAFINDSKTNYIYDENGRLITKEQYSYNFV